jgi:hypothetical protein
MGGVDESIKKSYILFATKASSSIGRAAVSKTVGCGFDSCLAYQIDKKALQ